MPSRDLAASQALLALRPAMRAAQARAVAESRVSSAARALAEEPLPVELAPVDEPAPLTETTPK